MTPPPPSEDDNVSISMFAREITMMARKSDFIHRRRRKKHNMHDENRSSASRAVMIEMLDLLFDRIEMI